jgi:citrate lyase subunit beta/citryl-CoA lyase
LVVDLLRTLLIVPATQGAAVANALRGRADAVVIDLEASIPPSEKERAREAAREAMGGLADEHLPVWVRVNPSHELLAKPDIRAVVSAALTGIVLPRATSANHIRFIEALLRDAEAASGIEAGKTKLIPVIESAAGLMGCGEIARASQRTIALAFGADDYCEDLGVERTRGGHELQFPRSQIAVSARAAGVLAIDAAYDDIHDDTGLRADTEAARSVGFHGKFLIDAAQAPTVNAIFRPTPEAVEYARRVVEAHEAAVERGEGITVIGGRMVDRPAASRARRLIELATAIEAREAQSAI